MSARETIENLWDRAIPVGPLLDQYAHELAEQIRIEANEEVNNKSWEGYERRFMDREAYLIIGGMRIGADLIDPEVEK